MFPSGWPLGEVAPVGCCDDSPNCRRRASPRRPRARICLRKGCGQKYLPRCWNQCYCQDPECLREVRRWQAAKRQAKRRQDEAVKAQHAQDQRARRQRATPAPQTPKPPAVAAARGHAAKIFPQLLCATGLAAMNRSPSRAASRRVSAAMPVARRFAGSVIVSASGGSAALSKAVAPANGSTPPPARDAPHNSAPAPAPDHRLRHPRDPMPPPRWSALCCRGLQAL